ncbi:GDSL-type esterase/lipase family protein [Aureliella helgolandensis]|uniref:SGNH hydrolase-type esterase domain-containing protein n=1 Tax=Aureliella helgolandensis TaxID=2527968 RepID=A0A518G905_9BACT|nr:GDSL-type esterase/lipase family protein [Aureliella helgolandensis]QDV25085.1 hypothetical protein Q31a_34070 [Aureliella helgolandensis]
MSFIGLIALLCFVPPTANTDAGQASTEVASQEAVLAPYRQAAEERWEDDIQKLEALDQTEVDPEHAILFIGSSSIRLWEDMAEDLAPWPTIRRGYGGAKISDLAVFTERLVSPHKFDGLVIFVANDIVGKEDDKSAEEVVKLYDFIVSTVRKTHPHQPIFFVEITPTSSRFHAWDRIQEANSKIADYSKQKKNLHVIRTSSEFLTDQGVPNDALFREDHLHLNRDGYQLWAKLIDRELKRVIK